MYPPKKTQLTVGTKSALSIQKKPASNVERALKQMITNNRTNQSTKSLFLKNNNPQQPGEKSPLLKSGSSSQRGITSQISAMIMK